MVCISPFLLWIYLPRDTMYLFRYLIEHHISYYSGCNLTIFRTCGGSCNSAEITPEERD